MPAYSLKSDLYVRSRAKMVEELIVKGIKDKGVLDAMAAVPRHLFVEPALLSQAYSDNALPIGEKQTISQPFIVALTCEALGLTGKEKVLDVGSGSGYQTAVLSRLADKVIAIERLAPLAVKARKALDDIFCPNVIMKIGDGTLGVPEEAPFDAIAVGAASPEPPSALMAQLKPGGRLVIPVGGAFEQELIRITKTDTSVTRELLCGCRFVKLIGKDGWKE